MSDIEFQELWYLTYGAIGIAVVAVILIVLWK
jgi:hypothetical protein